MQAFKNLNEDAIREVLAFAGPPVLSRSILEPGFEQRANSSATILARAWRGYIRRELTELRSMFLHYMSWHSHEPEDLEYGRQYAREVWAMDDEEFAAFSMTHRGCFY